MFSETFDKKMITMNLALIYRRRQEILISFDLANISKCNELVYKIMDVEEA